MTDDRLEQRLREEFTAEAQRVRTSPDAWARIQARAAGGQRRSAWAVLALVGAVAAAAVVALVTLPRPGSVTIGPDPAGRGAVTETPTPPPSAAGDGSDTAAPSPGPADPAGPTGAHAPRFTWSSVTLPTAGMPGASAEGIASVGDTVLVVGEDGDGGRAAWLSRDGGERFESQPIGDRGAWLDTAAVDGVLLVVGSEEGVPAVDVYDPVSGEWSPAYRGDREGTFYAVTDGPSGPIATGNVRAPDGREGLVAAPDADGVWRAVDAPGLSGPETVLYHAIGGPTGYVATGYGPDETSIVDTWYSADGRTWEHLNADPGAGIRATEGVIDSLAVDRATGRLWAVQAGGDLWSSADGRAWSVAASLGGDDAELGFRSPAALSTDDGVIVFAGTDEVTAYWIAAAADPVALDSIAGRSLTVGAGATRSGEAVLVPLSGPDGLFVWRGVPAAP